MSAASAPSAGLSSSQVQERTLRAVRGLRKLHSDVLKAAGSPALLCPSPAEAAASVDGDVHTLVEQAMGSSSSDSKVAARTILSVCSVTNPSLFPFLAMLSDVGRDVQTGHIEAVTINALQGRIQRAYERSILGADEGDGGCSAFVEDWMNCKHSYTKASGRPNQSSKTISSECNSDWPVLIDAIAGLVSGSSPFLAVHSECSPLLDGEQSFLRILLSTPDSSNACGDGEPTCLDFCYSRDMASDPVFINLIWSQLSGGDAGGDILSCNTMSVFKRVLGDAICCGGDDCDNAIRQIFPIDEGIVSYDKLRDAIATVTYNTFGDLISSLSDVSASFNRNIESDAFSSNAPDGYYSSYVNNKRRRVVKGAHLCKVKNEVRTFISCSYLVVNSMYLYLADLPVRTDADPLRTRERLLDVLCFVAGGRDKSLQEHVWDMVIVGSKAGDASHLGARKEVSNSFDIRDISRGAAKVISSATAATARGVLAQITGFLAASEVALRDIAGDVLVLLKLAATLVIASYHRSRLQHSEAHRSLLRRRLDLFCELCSGFIDIAGADGAIDIVVVALNDLLCDYEIYSIAIKNDYKKTSNDVRLYFEALSNCGSADCNNADAVNIDSSGFTIGIESGPAKGLGVRDRASGAHSLKELLEGRHRGGEAPLAALLARLPEGLGASFNRRLASMA